MPTSKHTKVANKTARPGKASGDVDAFMAALVHRRKDEVVALRKLILGCSKQITERIMLELGVALLVQRLGELDDRVEHHRMRAPEVRRQREAGFLRRPMIRWSVADGPGDPSGAVDRRTPSPSAGRRVSLPKLDRPAQPERAATRQRPRWRPRESRAP